MFLDAFIAKHTKVASDRTTLKTLGISALGVVLAVGLGAVATTGNPIAIAVATGLLVGGFLLIRQDVAVWIVIVGTTLINGAVGLAFPSLTKIAWLFSMLGFLLLCGSALTLLGSKKSWVGFPIFIELLLIQMVIAVALSFIGESTTLEILAGTKRAFQLTGLMLAIALIPTNNLGANRTNAWLMFLLTVAFFQLPAAIFERLVLVPLRVGMSGGVVAIDIVSGTFESSLEGGGSSSIMVIFLIIALAFVLAAWKVKVLSFRKMALSVLVLGAPLFLGETKIALVLLPMMVALIFGTEIRRHPVATIFGLAVAGLLTVVLAWVYLSILSTGTTTTEQQIQNSIDYNFGSVGYYDRYSLNRTTATTFWITEHGLKNPVETVIGHGIGSSYSGAGSLAPGHLNKQYPFMAINLTAISTLLWDTGVLGTSLFLSAFYMAWRAATRQLKNAVNGKDIAIISAIRVSLACNIFAIFYSNSMFASLSHETILAVTLGYLAWLERKNVANATATKKPHGHAHSLSYP